MNLPSLAGAAAVGVALVTLVIMQRMSRSPTLTNRAKAGGALIGWLIVALCGGVVWAIAQSQIRP